VADLQIREEALLTPLEAAAMKERISTLIVFGSLYWRPLHMRMDYWASLYFLLDQIQQMKPLGYRRFISNEPRTAVDTAVSIMTRNDAFWRIDLNQMEAENKEERDKIGKIERTLQGVVIDVDEMCSMRGELPLWKQISYQALLRGWIWGKFHVTTAALDYRESPIIADIYDSRTVYPHFDNFGLESVIIRQLTTLGDLASIYPEVYADMTGDMRNFDPNKPAEKIEFWSNQRGDRPGITGVLAVVSPDPAGSTYYMPPETGGNLSDARWLIPAHKHGYDPQSLPIIGVPVNGVAIKYKPPIPDPISYQFQQRADLLGVQTRFWQGRNTWVAESGRSILSAVEEQIPQYNELVATIFQHFSLGTYGTWVFKTPTGELPKFTPNIEGRVALRPEESVERLEPTPITADAFRLMEILRQEQQQGTLSAILRASMPMGGGDLASGILFSQMTSAALNALEPYMSGLKQFGQRMGTSLLNQMQLAARELRPFSVSVPFKQNTFFSIEFDPVADMESGRKYRARPVFRPALPDDMHIRIQMARLALDPRRPILSLTTVLETILQKEDPQGEMDLIWEDLANQDPVLVLEQIAQALERFGEKEMAARMRESGMRARMIEDLKFRQITGTVPGGGAAPGMGPETGVPESTQRRGEAEQAGERQRGMELVGSMGERAGV
jgi:hypothetical protein